MGRSAWIDAAYAAFEDGGIEAVRVDPLAKSLRVTRGSFYWHFKDRASLLASVLERWDEDKTEATIDANESAGGDPRERLLRLLESCASEDGRFEMGIRAWAAQDDKARSAVERTDARRIKYMRDLLVGAGIEASEAGDRARVIYLAWLGAYSSAVASSPEQRLRDIRVLWRLSLVEDARPQQEPSGPTSSMSSAAPSSTLSKRGKHKRGRASSRSDTSSGSKTR